MAGRRIRCSRVSFFDLMLIPGALVCPFNHICMMMDCTLTWSACWKKSEKQRFLWAGVFIFRGLPANATRLECKPASQHMSGIFLIFHSNRNALQANTEAELCIWRLKGSNFKPLTPSSTRSKVELHSKPAAKTQRTLLIYSPPKIADAHNAAIQLFVPPSFIHRSVLPSPHPSTHSSGPTKASVPFHATTAPNPHHSVQPWVVGCWQLLAGLFGPRKCGDQDGCALRPPTRPPANQPSQPASTPPTVSTSAVSPWSFDRVSVECAWFPGRMPQRNHFEMERGSGPQKPCFKPPAV